MLRFFEKKTLFFTLVAFLFSYAYAENAQQYSYKFKQLTTLNGLPSNDVQKVYQGRDGYIWIASRNGLFQYDGYSVTSFRSNLYNPALLSNNNIYCLCEDFDQRLWIGTYKGLNMLDRKTGKIIQVNRKEFINNTISAILVTKQGDILLGTDQGLYQYIYETDSCILYNRDNTKGVFPETSVKSMIEDSYGHIWIGTWNNGLYRYQPDKGVYYAYPQMNMQNSAHELFEDSRKRIWVATWGGGLQVLENAYDMEKVRWKTFVSQAGKPNSLPNNIIYSISEDINSGKIWIGTRMGLSILDNEKEGYFINYYPGSSDQSISDNEVNSIIRDSQGMMWLGLLRGGVNIVNTRKPYFLSYSFPSLKKDLNTNSIGTLFVDKNETMWLGVSGYGLVLYDRKNNKHVLPSDLEDFNHMKIPSILTIAQLKSNGQVWIGTHNMGIYVYDSTKKSKEKITWYPPDITPWLSGHQIFAIFEDSDTNKWIGSNYGLTMVNSDFEYLRFDSLECNGKKLRSAIVTDIKEGEKYEIWVASNNSGIYKIIGKGKSVSDYKITNYTVSNGKLNSTNISCIFKDTRGRIWAGSEGGGLNFYDRTNDTFVPVHKLWNLPGDAIYNILEDGLGDLWMGTNSGLMKLHIQDDELKNASYRMYAISDGLLNNSFPRRAFFETDAGEMFFGGNHGLNSFYPDQFVENTSVFPPVVITDIKIHNHSWSDLDNELRSEISRFTPEFTDEIKLDYKNNNFMIEFATLGYETPGQYTYAYKLEGFDAQWQYTSASRRFAYYNNLKSGTYQFYLKTTNANGVWSSRVISLKVVILPPPWETWWAYLIYIAIISAIVIFVYRMLSNRIRLENELQFREIEQAKAEELNHAKLQFFTNITHELLTPLTIISASVDELKIQAPQYANHYQMMVNNINRLIRLLQQILEFRKAETGNLKLKVSQGDLAAFVSNSVESFQPLIKKKKMNLAVICNPPHFPAYFDPDKLDKILYNLLSNASKYNKTKGNIMVELSIDDTRDYAVITVSDDGMGISKEVQKDLFKRFYEGDYRKFNTIGTGIGLSLTKDLVALHGGEITVESDKGKGTLFRVAFPFRRKYFKEDEIDETLTDIELNEVELENTFEEDNFSTEDKSPFNILLVEDNEDLLQLMVKLLSSDYTIHTAFNGKEGLDVLSKEDIDLVVSDIMMPVMDGVEFCKIIKNEFEYSHIPVLLLTAKTGEMDRINAYDSGADSYLTKPFNLSILHARIKNLLKARERINRDFKKQLVFEAKELNYTSIDEEFLQKAIECVHENLSDPSYDQTQFVKDMGTSRSTLFRKMKSLTGLSYVSFIRNVRLKAACHIMEEKKNIRVSELAYAVGFNDPRYFSTCFKKEFGMLPREYYEKFILGQDDENVLDNDPKNGDLD